MDKDSGRFSKKEKIKGWDSCNLLVTRVPAVFILINYICCVQVIITICTKKMYTL